MRNITFSADERLIEAARERARSSNSTLNEEFWRWLEAYACRDEQAALAMQVIEEMRSRISTGGRHFTRKEMNER